MNKLLPKQTRTEGRETDVVIVVVDDDNDNNNRAVSLHKYNFKHLMIVL
jgi:hypothetical protein